MRWRILSQLYPDEHETSSVMVHVRGIVRIYRSLTAGWSRTGVD